MKTFHIARAKPGDAAELTALAFAAKRHWGYPESWIQAWTEQLTITPEFIGQHPVVVALREGEALGVAAVEITGEEAVLLHFWVKPSAMQQGIGAALFAECEAIARHASAVRLIVESDPHAEGFYRKMGASVIGRVPAHVLNVERFLPKLEKTLERSSSTLGVGKPPTKFGHEPNK